MQPTPTTAISSLIPLPPSLDLGLPDLSALDQMERFKGWTVIENINQVKILFLDSSARKGVEQKVAV